MYTKTGSMVVDINDLPVVHEYSSIGAFVAMVCHVCKWPAYFVVQSSLLLTMRAVEGQKRCRVHLTYVPVSPKVLLLLTMVAVEGQIKVQGQPDICTCISTVHLYM
jgi:hypothetical protein